MRPSVRRLGGKLRSDDAAASLRLRKGIMVSETAGMVTLTLAGDTLTIPKLETVGPLAANDQVWLLAQDANPWLVVGREAAASQVQSGKFTMTAAGTALEMDRTLTFPAAFATVPVITIAWDTLLLATVRMHNVGTTTVGFAASKTDGTNITVGQTVIVHWRAVG